MTQAHPLEYLYPEELYKIKSKVLIVLSRPWSEIVDGEVVLLTKILSAVKLSLASVQIVTRASFTVDEFRVYQPTCIIAFGAALLNSSKMYEKVSVQDLPVVVADELRLLDEFKKKNLWLALKQVF